MIPASSLLILCTEESAVGSTIEVGIGVEADPGVSVGSTPCPGGDMGEGTAVEIGVAICVTLGADKATDGGTGSGDILPNPITFEKPGTSMNGRSIIRITRTRLRSEMTGHCRPRWPGGANLLSGGSLADS